MWKFQCLLSVLTRSNICYYIICITVPLSTLYRLLYLQWSNSKHSVWRPKLFFCNTILRFLYIWVSYTVAVSLWQSSHWYHQTANCLQGGVSCDYLWIVLYMRNSFCTGVILHQQWLSESQGHPFFFLLNLSEIGDIFGKHY